MKRVRLAWLAVSVLLTGPAALGQNKPAWNEAGSAGPGAAGPGTAPRDIRDRFTDHLNVRDYGAKCDGVADDSQAFLNAAAVATGHAPAKPGPAPGSHRQGPAGFLGIGPNPNGAVEIDIPAGRCVLNRTWLVEYNRNSALRFHGDGSSMTELQFNGGIDGLRVVFDPNTSGNDASRQGAWPGQGIMVDGIHFVSNTGIVAKAAANATNIGLGAGEKGTALSVIGTPLINASAPPMQRYEDLLFTNSGGWNDGANNWAGGVYLQDADNVYLEHISFIDNALDRNRVSIPIWIHSTAKAFVTAGHGNLNASSVTVSGGRIGFRIDGDAIQGVNVSHLATVGVGTGFSWQARQNSLSGSLTLDDSSMGAAQYVVLLNNVSTVFSHDNFFYNVAPPVGTDPVFFSASGGDTVISHHDSFYGPTAGYEKGGHQSTALYIHGYPVADTAPSLIDGDIVSHFDNGFVADGGPLVFSDDVVSSDTTRCYRDSGTELNPAMHPSFASIQCGRHLDDHDGVADAVLNDWARARTMNGELLLGMPGVRSPGGGILGQSGGIDLRDVASRTGLLAGLNAYDARLSVTGGVPGTSGQGRLVVSATEGLSLDGPVLARTIRYQDFAVPARPDASCSPGDSGDGLIGPTAYHFFCTAPNHWVRVAMAAGRSATSW